ncbi:MAG: allantoinase AllB [Planctomycetota bacterium]
MRAIRSRKVLIDASWSPADIIMDEQGRIAEVVSYMSADVDATVGEKPAAVIDHGELCVMPGLVDTHVHLNEPGRTEWEGATTGTAAAKAGGITTLIDMPLNSSPVTTSLTAIREKAAAVSGKLSVDMGFHGGLIPDNARDIGALCQSGVWAIKAFLCPSGLDEFPHVTRGDLEVAMPIIADAGHVLMVHAEVQQPAPSAEGSRRYVDHMKSRPPAFERVAIEMMIDLVRQTRCPVHIVHLADAGCLDILASAREEGLPITVETCPHYLIFDADSVADGDTRFKCAPPIRDRANREGLWQGLRDGVIDFIVSDHSPCPPEDKDLSEGRFDHAWGGISSLQIGLPAVWTEACKRGHSLVDVWRWMSAAPGELIGMEAPFQPGRPAHICVFDPGAIWKCDARDLHHRHAITPYDGRTFQGKVVTTYVWGDASQKRSGRLVHPTAGEAL